MKICRFNDDRLGVVQDNKTILDVTGALEALPPLTWPVPLGDALVTHLAVITSEISRLASDAPTVSLKDIMLKSPVANPSKIMGAPINYQKHIEAISNLRTTRMFVSMFINDGVLKPCS